MSDVPNRAYHPGRQVDRMAAYRAPYLDELEAAANDAANAAPRVDYDDYDYPGYDDDY